MALLISTCLTIDTQNLGGPLFFIFAGKDLCWHPLCHAVLRANTFLLFAVNRQGGILKEEAENETQVRQEGRQEASIRIQQITTQARTEEAQDVIHDMIIHIWQPQLYLISVCSLSHTQRFFNISLCLFVLCIVSSSSPAPSLPYHVSMSLNHTQTLHLSSSSSFSPSHVARYSIYLLAADQLPIVVWC